MLLALAAKRLFKREGGDPAIFDRIPPKLQTQYIERANEMMASRIPPDADPRRVYMFGEPLAA